MADKKSNDAAKDAAERALKAAAAKKSAEKKKVEHTYTHVGQESVTTEDLLAATKKNALPHFRVHTLDTRHRLRGAGDTALHPQAPVQLYDGKSRLDDKLDSLPRA